MLILLVTFTCSCSTGSSAEGTWRVISVAGESIDDIAQKTDLSDEESTIIYVFNSDGTGIQKNNGNEVEFTWSENELLISGNRVSYTLSKSGSQMSIPISSGEVLLSRIG